MRQAAGGRCAVSQSSCQSDHVWSLIPLLTWKTQVLCKLALTQIHPWMLYPSTWNHLYVTNLNERWYNKYMKVCFVGTLNRYMEAETKWPLFCRRHLQTYIILWGYCIVIRFILKYISDCLLTIIQHWFTKWCRTGNELSDDAQLSEPTMT